MLTDDSVQLYCVEMMNLMTVDVMASLRRIELLLCVATCFKKEVYNKVGNMFNTNLL